MLQLLENVPARAHVGYALLGLACGFAGTLIGVAAVPPKPVTAPTIAVATVEEPVRIELPPTRAYEAVPAIDSAIHFTLTADDATYIALEDLDPAALPPHGRPRLVTGMDATVMASLPARALEARTRAWRGREVIVDGTCRAKVTRLDLVAQILGDPSYISDDDRVHHEWDAESVLDRGHVMLAARLDGCTGTFARAAEAPAIRVFVPIDDATHATELAEARRRLIASDAGTGAAHEWASFEQAGAWYEQSELSTLTVRDPDRGTTWISMHAHTETMCGGPNVNVWGLFRIEPDGTLTTVQLRELGELDHLDRLVDIDNDGMPELVGRGWISPDAAITDAAGTTLTSISTPFVGCPC